MPAGVMNMIDDLTFRKTKKINIYMNKIKNYMALTVCRATRRGKFI